jgi:hypothetical protein
VNPGGGEATEDKQVMASIFSIYNLSRQMDAFKRSKDEYNMADICQLLKTEADDTLILLYLRDDYSSEITSIKQEESLQITSKKIRNNSIF